MGADACWCRWFQAGHQVVGLDASPAMLALARQKLDAAGSAVSARARLVQGDMREFALGETFDFALIAVKSLAYLVHRVDQQRVLAAIAAHLRPGGLLALDLMHRRQPGSCRLRAPSTRISSSTSRSRA